jgi:acyl transferase domain-containing protein
MTDNLAAFIEQHGDTNLADLAYTLQVGRRVFKHRRFAVCDGASAINALRTRAVTKVCEPRTRSVVFMFPGQGSQYVNMGLELYQNRETFREDVDRCCEILRPLLGQDLRSILYPSEDQSESATRKLVETSFTQPALFVVEYAVARLWMQLGVQPKKMIGHSIGEYVAACLAGVFSLEDALALVATRGRMMQQLASGAMLTVALAEQEVVPLIDERLSLAVVNGPQLCVVAGAEEAISGFEERLTKRNIVSRRLHTSHAFHSSMMEPILSEFAAQVRKVKLQAPSIPYVSNVTGNLITAAEATDANYWSRHLRQTVRFGDGLNVLLKEREQVLLEVGPGQSLSMLAKRQLEKDSGHAVVSSLPPAKATRSGDEQWLHAMGQLWLEGVNLNWSRIHAGQRRRRLPLPSYPFERQRYWIGFLEGDQPIETVTKVATPPINGNGNAPAKIPPQVNPHESIVTKQLRLMSAQLEVLRKRHKSTRNVL